MKQFIVILYFVSIILTLSSRNRIGKNEICISENKQEYISYSKIQKDLYSCFLKKENKMGPMLYINIDSVDPDIRRPYPLILSSYVNVNIDLNDTLKYNPINDTIIWINIGEMSIVSSCCEIASTIDTVYIDECFPDNDETYEIVHDNRLERIFKRKYFEKLRKWDEDDLDSIFIEKSPLSFKHIDAFIFIGRSIIKNNEIVELVYREVSHIERSKLKRLR